LKRYIAAGFIYGLCLLLISMIAAGAGHGTYRPLTVISSPLSLFNLVHPGVILGTFFAVIAFFGAPFLWGTVGYLLWRAANGKGVGPLIALMSAHYTAGLYVAFSSNSNFEDFDYFWRAWNFGLKPTIEVGLVLYGSGQLFLWGYFMYAVRRQRK
jgi:hypothetical protein